MRWRSLSLAQVPGQHNERPNAHPRPEESKANRRIEKRTGFAEAKGEENRGGERKAGEDLGTGQRGFQDERLGTGEVRQVDWKTSRKHHNVETSGW